MSTHRSIAWCCLVSCGACAGAPPFAPEPVPVAIAHRWIRTSDGASGEVVDNAPQADSKSVRLDVFALTAVPTAGSIEPQLLAIARDGGAPFRAASSLPAATRWSMPAAGTDAGRLVGSADAAVAPGVETVFTPATAPLPAIACTSTPDGVRLHLLPAGTNAVPERAVLREPLTEAMAGMVFVPARDATFAGHALVLTVVGPAAPEAVAAAQGAARAAATAETRPGPARRQLALAAAAIGEQPRRAAMLAIAAQFDLAACTDILLAADEAQLIAIGRNLLELDATHPDYAWHFQRALWTALVPGLQRDELPPGLRAAVIRQLGAVAGEPTVLLLHLQASPDAAAFAVTLRDENGFALDDRDPVLRVQAHAWLGRHGTEVAGYDPLAAEPLRSEALRAHRRAEAAR